MANYANTKAGKKGKVKKTALKTAMSARQVAAQRRKKAMAAALGKK